MGKKDKRVSEQPAIMYRQNCGVMYHEHLSAWATKSFMMPDHNVGHAKRESCQSKPLGAFHLKKWKERENAGKC